MKTLAKWQTVPIKSVYEGLYDGPHATPAPCADGPVFLGIKNITDDGALDLTDIRHISESEFPRWTKRVNPQAGDIVFTYEATLNRYAIIPDGFRGCLGRRMALIRTNPGKVDTRFLHFYFFSKQWRKVIASNILTGATVDRIPLTKFPDFPITIPDLPTQRKIAGILSAYDDLIENNLRRIKILEDMAQSLYREWFVHFRFPGHESAKFVDSELGRIPKGWEWKKVGDVFEIQGGGTPSTANEEYWVDGDIQWYSPRDLTAENTMFIEKSAAQINELGLKKSSAKMFPAYSVMLTSRATIGAIAINTVPSCTNQGFITCLPNAKVPLYFLHQWLKANVETFVLHASGSTFKEISKGVFKSLDFLQPAANLVHRYQEAVEPISDQLLNLQRRNQNLRRTREMLLPKLLTHTD
jgi:type I restriction enzyme S subunit